MSNRIGSRGETMSTDEITKINENLMQSALNYSKASISLNTRKAYENDFRDFAKWCIAHELEPFPATPLTVVLYLTNLADSGILISTISRKSTSISVIHTASNEISPCKSHEVATLLHGIRRTNGIARKKARPISWSELKKMVDQCDSSIFGRRDECLLLLGWMSAMRRSELTALNIDDIENTNDGLIINIRRSKTDQEAAGYIIGLPRTHDRYCPAESLKKWIDRKYVTEKQKHGSDPVFSNLGVKGRKKWWAESRSRLSDRMISLIVKRYAELIGINPETVSAHSLRRGFATEAGAAGIPERIISRHTRHQTVGILREYIDRGQIWVENPLSTICRSTSLPGGQ